MARGVSKTTEEKIENLEELKAAYQEKIEGYRAKITELDKQIKDLQYMKEQEKVQEILEAIEKSGKSVEDVLAAIGKKSGINLLTAKKHHATIRA